MIEASMVKILALDTSSTTGSVALCQGEKLVAESLLNVRSTHSERLLAQIDLLLTEAGWNLVDLDLFAVVTGPGSFTGLRIGIATIKGLAQVLDKPVVPVISLQAVAMNMPLLDLPVCVFIDARKSEVYTQLFQWDIHLGPVAQGEASVLPPDKLLETLPDRVALVGDGVPLYRQMIDEVLGERAQLPLAPAHQLRAAHVGWLAWQSWGRDLTVGAGNIVPTYIRPSDAEMNKK